MYNSEPRANSTFITNANKVYELRVGTTMTHRNTDTIKIQFQVDSTFHYRESTELQYPM